MINRISKQKPEVLSFTYQQIYVARQLIQSRKHLILFIKHLANRYNYPADKIIFSHDFEETDFKPEFLDNFKLNGSYNYIKKELEQ